MHKLKLGLWCASCFKRAWFLLQNVSGAKQISIQDGNVICFWWEEKYNWENLKLLGLHCKNKNSYYSSFAGPAIINFYKNCPHPELRRVEPCKGVVKADSLRFHTVYGGVAHPLLLTYTKGKLNVKTTPGASLIVSEKWYLLQLPIFSLTRIFTC